MMVHRAARWHHACIGLLLAIAAAGAAAADEPQSPGVGPRSPAQTMQPSLAQPTPAQLSPALGAPLPSPFGTQLPQALPPSLPSQSTVGRTVLRAMVRREAGLAGMPPDIADAVADVESSYNPDTLGAAGEVGLMQVMPATARMLGFAGTLAELAIPEINIHFGVMYLAQAWRLAGGDICTATMKYRAGHGETRFSYRSVDYCIKVRARLYAAGFPVTGTVPQATFGDPIRVAAGKGKLPLFAARGPDLEGLNSRLRNITNAVAVHATVLTLR